MCICVCMFAITEKGAAMLGGKNWRKIDLMKIEKQIDLLGHTILLKTWGRGPLLSQTPRIRRRPPQSALGLLC